MSSDANKLRFGLTPKCKPVIVWLMYIVFEVDWFHIDLGLSVRLTLLSISCWSLDRIPE